MRNPLAAGLSIWSRQDSIWIYCFIPGRLTVTGPLSLTELRSWLSGSYLPQWFATPPTLLQSAIKLFIKFISVLLVYWSTCTCHKILVLTQARWPQLGLTWWNVKQSQTCGGKRVFSHRSELKRIAEKNKMTDKGQFRSAWNSQIHTLKLNVRGLDFILVWYILWTMKQSLSCKNLMYFLI